MNDTRIDNDEALKLAYNEQLTSRHILVIGDKRYRAETRPENVSGYWWWYGDESQDYFSAYQLQAVLKLGAAHVELETPEPSLKDLLGEGWVVITPPAEIAQFARLTARGEVIRAYLDLHGVFRTNKSTGRFEIATGLVAFIERVAKEQDGWAK